MALKLFTTFIVVAAILASPKHRDFTWSYRSSIYRVHWVKLTRNFIIIYPGLFFLVVQWSRDKAFESLDGEYFSHNILDRQYTISELQKVNSTYLLTSPTLNTWSRLKSAVSPPERCNFPVSRLKYNSFKLKTRYKFGWHFLHNEQYKALYCIVTPFAQFGKSSWTFLKFAQKGHIAQILRL